MKLIILDVNCHYLIIIAFYAKHLQALKDAGIMTNISDPNATEMRGWVMLMLERAAETVNPSECNDPAVLLACSLGSDSCPAACQKDADETTVDENGNVVKVKSGDLQISAAAAEGRKVALNGGISDLDTITFKASEAITLNSVTLERFGFSSYKDVKNIWLENSNGVKIANEKSISSSKDTVTLNIKKGYRELNAEDTITVVVETNPFDAGSCADKNGDPVATAKTEAQCLIVPTNVWTAASYDTKNAGSTIGFKVTSVDSSAKNLNIDNYDAYLYDMVTYDSSKVSVTVKGKDATYHYINGNSYEVARFQVKAGNAAVAVNGFTLTNDGTYGNAVSNIDLDKFVDEVIVTLGDGTKLSNVKFDVNKDDELKVSFDEVEVAINKNIIFVVEVVFKDFDDYGKAVFLRLKNSGDLNVVEKKTGARATVELTNPIEMHKYLFQGGKIEVTNEKLASSIDASAGSNNITIGKGKITIGGESIELNSFVIKASPLTSTLATKTINNIESMKMLVNGDEYEAKQVANGFQFEKITIDEDSTIEFTVDIDNDAPKGTNIVFNNAFDKSTLKDANADKLGKYEDARTFITSDDWAGSISLSNVRVQAAKGSLAAGSLKDVEVIVKQTSRKTIFEGTYTAQKQDVYLNGFAVKNTETLAADANNNKSDITYYLSIDGKEVGSFDYKKAAADTKDEDFIKDNEQGFTDVLIKKDEKVSIKLEANVYGAAEQTYSPTLIIRGTDKDGNTAGFASETTSKIKVVSAGSVTVSDSVVTDRNSVVLRDSNINLARFTVKSSKNTEGMDLSNFKLEPTPNTTANMATEANLKNKIRIRVAGSELSQGTSVDSNGVVAGGDFFVDSDGKIFVSGLSENIPTAGVDVEVILKNPTEAEGGLYALTLSQVNTTTPSIKFTKKLVEAVASINAQENKGDSSTKFTFKVEKNDNKYINNLQLFVKRNGVLTPVGEMLSSVEDGNTIEISNGKEVEFIEQIAWGCSDATYYTANEAKTHNATLDGALSTTAALNADDAAAYNTAMSPASPKSAGVSLTEEEAAAYNAKLTGAVKEGDVKTAASCTTTVTKDEFRDFFRVGDSYAQIFRTK